MTPLRRSRPALVPALFALLLAASCAPQRGLDPEALRHRYLGAIRDAASAEPFEIHRRLDAVVPYAPGLVWSGEPGASELLVVNWTSATSFSPAAGEEIVLDAARWVTLAPRIERFCRAYRPRRGAPLELRLEQLLGLPPQAGKRHFVEMWVSPADLWRPCPDPEITDNECSLVPPAPSSATAVSDAYREWFESYREGVYGDDGYPWTRLGYTYDWGNPRSEVGLSEFVVRPGARVRVRSVEPTADYCSR